MSGVVSGGLWWWPVVVVVCGGEKWCNVVPKGGPEMILLIGAGGRAGGKGRLAGVLPPRCESRRRRGRSATAKETDRQTDRDTEGQRERGTESTDQQTDNM